MKISKPQAGETAVLLLLAALFCIVSAVATADATTPVSPAGDRHDDLTSKFLHRAPVMPEYPIVYETPAHLRARETFWIVIENWQDGRIYQKKVLSKMPVNPWVSELREQHEIGKVLAPI